MDNLIQSTPLLLAGVFIFGLLIGSFLNVAILRYPSILEYDWRCQCRELLNLQADLEQSPPGLVISRSRCPNCGHLIKSWENIPLVSFIFLRGRCSDCGSRISLRYPIVEFLTGSFFVATILNFGFTPQGISALFLTASLIVLAGIDFDHQLLPDTITLPLMWSGMILSLWSVHADLRSSVLGAVAGYLILWIIYHLFRLLTGKEGMGYGDFKLLAALGAWLGWQILPMIVLLSSLLGAIVGLVLMGTGRLKRDKPMPFGPFIAGAGWVAMIWGERILDRYLFHYSLG